MVIALSKIRQKMGIFGERPPDWRVSLMDTEIWRHIGRRPLAVRLIEDENIFLANYCVVLAWRINFVQSPDFVPDRTYYAADTRIDSIIYGRMPAVVMNPVRQLHWPGSMSWLNGQHLQPPQCT
jgi:hypothetical protein